MEITAKDVANLRNMTGAGMMDCKRALVEANGDVDKAVEILRESGVAKAIKKQSRIAAEGVVGSFISNGTGALVEINCESDFVSKGEPFHNIVNAIAKVIVEQKPANLEELNACKLTDGQTVTEFITNQIAVIGEKIAIRRFEIYNTTGVVESYIHMGGKVGVMVEAVDVKGNEQLLHDIALQIAAAKPEYVSEADVPSEVVEKEKEVQLVQMQNDPKNASKPKEILQKIVLGKMSKYYAEVCLLNQQFIKDDSQTVKAVIGNNFKIVRFARWEMGEGLEKRVDDFAAEVAAQTKQK